MIRYKLQCDKDHTFDAWFSNSTSYDEQAGRNLVMCPECGSVQVSKAIMAPNIGTKDNRKSIIPLEEHTRAISKTPELQQTVTPAVAPELPEKRHEIISAMRKIRKIIEEKAEYVGPRFAEEARKIHYEEVEEKGIYGEASQLEVKELLEEGVDIQPFPMLPEDQN